MSHCRELSAGRAVVGPLLAVYLGLTVLTPSVRADIAGGTGNRPIKNEHWPAGAADIFNFEGRIAWFEGPPYGGGQYCAECRGDAKQLNEILAAFDRMDSKNKRVVVRDGVGESFWLKSSREAKKSDETKAGDVVSDASKIDWKFMVWSKEKWKRFADPKDEREPDDPALEPLSQIDIYVGGNVDWSKIAVPKGLTVLDERK